MERGSGNYRRALAWCVLLAACAADAAARERPTLRIPRVDAPPRLEQFLGMAPPPELAGTLAHVQGFVQQTPVDGEPASQHTEVWLGYDDHALYAVFVAHDREPERIRAHLDRRESVFGDEIVEIMLDTFDDRHRAYAFIATPLGVQWDAVWTEGRGFDDSWDAVWESRGRLTPGGYVVWMAIPFSSLRFPRTPEQSWGLVLVRDIPRNNESSFWPPVSSAIQSRLEQGATLVGLRDISPGRNIQLVPYATARRFRALDDASAAFAEEGFDPDAGLDAKLVLRDALAFDLTLNPDFSQVESDEPQVTVNRRFEVFFPEKRPFFLENAGFFATPLDLLFTRRIADPVAGARMTGKLGGFALGALAVADEAPGRLVDPDDPLRGDEADVGVLRLRRDLPRQSSAGFLFTERRFGDRTNRVGGLDARWRAGDHWNGTVQGVLSTTHAPDGAELSDRAWDVQVNREGRHFTTHAHYTDIGPDFRTDLGFVPRVGVRQAHQSLGYTVRPAGSRLVSWRPGLFVERVTDHGGTRLDERIEPSVSFELRGPIELGASALFANERLRASDLPPGSPALVAPLDFSADGLAAWVSSRASTWIEWSVNLSGGDAIHFVPPLGELPRAARRSAATAELTLRPGRRLRIESGALWTRLDETTGERLFDDVILRARCGLQLTPRLALRAIVQHERLRPDPSRTRLERETDWNADLLVSYVVDPWTVIYAGYNGNWRNAALVDGPGGSEVIATRDRLTHDARQLFVKASYLVRF